MLHKVSDLPPNARGVVESLVGRPLAEHETVSIRPLHLQKVGADTHLANEAADRLEEYFAEIDLQHPIVNSDEAEAAVDEAMWKIRPGYAPRR
jgi:hypothetical protein